MARYEDSSEECEKTLSLVRSPRDSHPGVLVHTRYDPRHARPVLGESREGAVLCLVAVFQISHVPCASTHHVAMCSSQQHSRNVSSEKSSWVNII
jgi:hypothetical protein